ncbi:hypothetical protein ACIBTP_34525 [Streptomyces avidinii]|uniref:hypothetical protein n=1 Tax=Streptomyces avidinii TaxID=1895 RepID=UPI00379C3C84
MGSLPLRGGEQLDARDAAEAVPDQRDRAAGGRCGDFGDPLAVALGGRAGVGDQPDGDGGPVWDTGATRLCADHSGVLRRRRA